MRGSLQTAAVTLTRVVLLAGPSALAFFSGGFFDTPRTVAAVVAWALVALLALAGGILPLPRSLGGRVALCALALLAGWTALSASWAPLEGPAQDDTVRLLLYLGALMAGVAAWADRAAARALEPALAAGVLVVIGYSLVGRVLPGLADFAASESANARLEQPLTYWNAMGALAAIGLLLSIRLMGDLTRARALRIAAAGAVAPLAAGLYLTLSRGAVAALLLGLVLLVLLEPSRAQLRAIALALGAAVLAAWAASVFAEVESLVGSASQRQGEGAAVLALLVGVIVLAALAHWALTRSDPVTEPPLPRASAALLGSIAALVIALPLSAMAIDAVAPSEGDVVVARNTTAFGSNRYSYWEVAAGTFAEHPLRGAGSGSFRVEWERERDIDEVVRDAHSLYIETGAELGLVGLALLAAFLAGLLACARRAYARDATLVTGWCGALAVLALHAGLDWDWEMPALAGIGIVLGGALICVAGRDQPPEL